MTGKKHFVLASDHTGQDLKTRLKKHLESNGITCEDVGTYSLVLKEYPVCVLKAASLISEGKYDNAILIDSHGIAASIAANRFPSVRAALCTNSEMACIARKHADANILVLASRYTTSEHAVKIIDQWLHSKPGGDTDVRYMKIIDEDTKLKVALGHLDTIDIEKFGATTGGDHILVHRAEKSIEHILSLIDRNRRKDSEQRLPESCPATLMFEGSEIPVLMTDLSAGGARFRLKKADERFRLPVGQSYTVKVRTPYGPSEFEGEIVWFDAPFFPTWGMKFLKLSEDENDPLKNLIKDV
ncbi:MAG: RpiB/LacA/LacB family sugar-phosphate isomerase [Candidatus Latescibacteria bacterium]|nr:RpiB/LacA/LacB family sugar-phosphate isomerase [Candidatus Latescibacterota bacterium]